VQSACDQGLSYELTYRIITATGDVKWVREQGVGVSALEGEILTLEGFIADVTGRVQAENALLRYNHFLAALHQTTLDLLSQLDLDVLLENIVTRAGQIIGTTSGYLDLLDSKSGQLRPRVGIGALVESLNLIVKPGEGIAGTIWQTGEPLVVNDYDQWAGRIGDFRKKSISSIIGVPLISGGDVIGVLGLAHEAESNDTFGDEEIGYLVQFARLATLAIHNANLFRDAQIELAARQRIEEELREREALLRETGKMAKVGGWEIEAKTLEVKWTEVTYHIHELPLSYKPPLEEAINFFHPDDRPILEHAIKMALEREEPYDLELRFITAQGNQLWTRTIGKPVMVDGKTVKLSGVFQDITQEVESKQERQDYIQQLETLRQASLHVTSSLALQPVLDAILEHTLELIPADDAHIFLYDGETLSFGAVRWADGRQSEPFAQPRQNGLTYRVARSGKQVVISNSKDHPMFEGMGWDGSITGIPLNIEGMTVGVMNIAFTTPHTFDQNELRILGLLADQAAVAIYNARLHEQVMQDAAALETRVQERTLELREAQDQLIRKERLTVLGELAGSVAHELRNPLGVISNAIYILRSIIPEEEKTITKNLRIIDEETKNASNIVTDLLDYARVRPGKQQAVTVISIVEEVFRRQPVPENVDLYVEIPEELPHLKVDPQQIGQVLDNLVINAYQAMPDGGNLSLSSMALTASSDEFPFEANSFERWILITVQDTGRGIAPQYIKKVFEPLFTTKATGIGLGLAISKKLVEANEGKIELDSTQDGGSSFRIYLPVVS
jgi:signal transduction histidine kinase/PAS domain-containing protein